MDTIKRVKTVVLLVAVLPLMFIACEEERDEDNFVINDEWAQSEFYFSGSEYGAYNEWDLDNDGRLEEEEFEAAVDVGLFDSWDINDDGWIEDQELSHGVFDSFDNDDDGLLGD